MRSRLFTSALALAAVAAPAAAQQQTSPRAAILDVAPYAGYMIFGKFLEGPLGTSVGNQSAPVYGAQVGMGLSKNLTLIGNVAYAKSDVEVGVPVLGGLSVGNSEALIYDAGLQYKFDSPMQSGLRPFVQLGAGAIRYDIDAASIVKLRATNFAANGGVGVDYQISPNLAITALAKDYVGKFDFKEATQFDLVDGKLAHNFALTLGVKLGF